MQTEIKYMLAIRAAFLYKRMTEREDTVFFYLDATDRDAVTWKSIKLGAFNYDVTEFIYYMGQEKKFYIS